MKPMLCIFAGVVGLTIGTVMLTASVVTGRVADGWVLASVTFATIALAVDVASLLRRRTR